MKSIFKKLLDKTFGKFILVGIVNTLFGSAVMFGFYNLLHCSYWFSSIANYVLGSILSYFLNKYFTFQNKKKSVKQVLAFVANISTCYLIAYGLAKPLIAYILSGATKIVQENIAMLLGMGLFVILNYTGQRLLVFKKKTGTAQESSCENRQKS